MTPPHDDIDPIRLLSEWWQAARDAGEPMPDAMTLATITADGWPAACMVILRGVDRGLVFYPDLEAENLFGADRLRCAHWKIVGTHTGDFCGIAPTGRRISVENAEIYEFDSDDAHQVTASRSLGDPSNSSGSSEHRPRLPGASTKAPSVTHVVTHALDSAVANGSEV